MAKKVTGYIKLQIPAGKATPAPPVGPALGQHGVNIVEFTKQFNARTADQGDLIIPVVITVYADRSFSFITKTPPAAVLIKKACKIQKASGEPNKKKVAKITKAQVQEIAELKMKDLLRDGLLLGVARLPMSVAIRLLHCVPALIGAALIWFWNPMIGMLILFSWYALIGFALSRFITASYTNAVFDRFINPRIEGAKVNQGLFKPEDDEDDADEAGEGETDH